MIIDMKTGINLRVQILPELCSLCNYNIFSLSNQLWIKCQDIFGILVLVKNIS